MTAASATISAERARYAVALRALGWRGRVEPVAELEARIPEVVLAG
jgi:hypothetical protein